MWDPVTGATSLLSPPGYDLFCAGHVFLADGRLFVAGGHVPPGGVGLPNASMYDAFNDVWTRAPTMNAGRWYPTATVLRNGDVLVVSGRIDNSLGENRLPAVYQVAEQHVAQPDQRPTHARSLSAHAPGAGWQGLQFRTEHCFAIAEYVRDWIVERRSRNHSVNVYRDYGASVMYGPGRILVAGGGDPPTNTAEVIDLTAPSPAWRQVASMAFARRHVNATVLPDGKVFMSGGTSGPGFNNSATPVFASEMWDPTAETWTTMASAQIPRLYHSAVVLLPDGRLVSTGGNGYKQVEMYEPPYLFAGARPTINSVPSAVAHGQTLLRGNGQRRQHRPGHLGQFVVGNSRVRS